MVRDNMSCPIGFSGLDVRHLYSVLNFAASNWLCAWIFCLYFQQAFRLIFCTAGSSQCVCCIGVFVGTKTDFMLLWLIIVPQFNTGFILIYAERPIPFRAACESRPSSCRGGATTKLGRPKLTITEDVLERRRLSKRRQNVRRTIQQGLNAKLASYPGVCKRHRLYSSAGKLNL